jgi:beta-aspartyl-dipeptidase (metallo-type)
MKLIKQAKIYSPAYLGKKDILIGAGQILAIEDEINIDLKLVEIFDASNKIVVPGFIDQHIHLTGAGGNHSFASMTSELQLSELIACGTTTVVGLLGTDGTTRSLESLYAKVKALEQQGITGYMFSNYYGLPTITLMNSVKDDIVFIDKVIGCKIAISDIRSSYPSDQELLRLLTQIHVGGLLAGKGGILHVHLGGLNTGMDPLMDLVNKYNFPIKYISPTHVGRSKPLFDQAIEFAKMGGMIDITTGASKYDEPYKQVLYAIEAGVSIDQMTFSSDGNAGLSKIDSNGCKILYKAPIDQNLAQVKLLIKEGGLDISDAIKLITSNPAKNLSLKHKGDIAVGADADFCFFNDDLDLQEVIAKGKLMMLNGKILPINEV